MKSYEEHLKSLMNKSSESICHRASSIFPVFSSASVQMELLFLNYWLLKRKIDHILCRIYLRNWKGNLVFKKCFYVDAVRAYAIKMSDLVGSRYPFSGSIEVEFASPENLVFPYPAVVVHYTGNHFSTFVHSAQRTFNDSKDRQANERSLVVESGFNIYRSEDVSPFLTFTNGTEPLKNKGIQLAAYNYNQKVIGAHLQLDCKPYETRYLSLENWDGLKKHLNGRAGCIKAKIASLSVFPRLLVGNRNHQNGSLSVTHTYYDLVQSKKPSDYWPSHGELWHAAALMLPLKHTSKYYSRVYFYPIYSPSSFWINLEIYNLKGVLMKSASKVFHQQKTPNFSHLDLNAFCKDLDSSASYTVKLVAEPELGSSIPARIKIGYDVGLHKGGFPCNICTNFYPANPDLDQKLQAFRWAPLMKGRYLGSIWCMNDAPKKNYRRKAKINLSIFRQSDSKRLTKNIEIAPHAATLIEHTQEISSFLEESTGWCTFESDNPHITTYYFSEHPSGMIGGDHGF